MSVEVAAIAATRSRGLARAGQYRQAEAVARFIANLIH